MQQESSLVLFFLSNNLFIALDLRTFCFACIREAYVRILVLLHVETIKRVRDASFVLTEPDNIGSHRHEQEKYLFEIRATCHYSLAYVQYLPMWVLINRKSSCVANQINQCSAFCLTRLL